MIIPMAAAWYCDGPDPLPLLAHIAITDKSAYGFDVPLRQNLPQADAKS
jgi:hypothetical protein